MMWHGTSVNGLVVPAGALYAAESLLIALCGTWTANATEVMQHLVGDWLEISADLQGPDRPR